MRLSLPLSLGCAALLLGGNQLAAAPVTYLYDDTAAVDAGVAGIGTFTLDVGSALGDYSGAGVSGGPGIILGNWTTVAFRASAGDQPRLSIEDDNGTTYTQWAPGIGGGLILPTSQADLEWANYVSQMASDWGVSITPVTTGVPDGGSSLFLMVTALGGLGLLARSRR